MPPQERSSIAAATADILPSPTVYLGRNLSISNNSSDGLNIGSLQLQTKSIISSKGININRVGANSSLTIDVDGNMKTNGLVDTIGSITTSSSLNSTSINVNGGNFTVADSGDVTTSGDVVASGDLSIGSNFSVISSNGAVTTGTVTSTGSISIGGTINSPNMILGNDGKITALNDLNINSGKFSVSSSNGNVSAAGDLIINSNKFTVASSSGNVSTAGNVSVDGNVSAVGTLSATGSLAINNDKFTVAASSGNVYSAGSVSIDGNVSAVGTLSATGSLAINTNKFTVAASSGDVYTAGSVSVDGDVSVDGTLSVLDNLSVNDKFTVEASTGKAKSDLPYASYTINSSSSNTTTTTLSGAEPVFDSVTNKYLTTQEYVDKEIWKQTKRINTMLGSDETVQTFENVLKVVTAIAGSSDVVTTLNNVNGKYDDLVDKQAEVKTSLSQVVAQAHNNVLVNCTPTVWQDECGPMPIPNTITSKTIEDGWYFSNLTTGNKINWYMPTNGSDMTVADVQNMYLNLFAASDMSLPFIHIYTAPKNNATDYWPGFANAKINYIFSAASPSLTANKSYCLHTGVAPMNVYNKTLLSCQLVQTSNATNKNNGTQGSNGTTFDSAIVSPSDKILFFTIGTSALASANNVCAVINSLNICVKTGTTQFSFSNAGVVSNYLFNYFFQKNTDFTAFPAPVKQGAYAEKYNSIFYPSPPTN
jgi:hypothetical protein